MIYVIAEPCDGVCDTACVDVCPVDCIHGPAPLDEIRAVRDDGEGALKAKFGEPIMLYIDPDECIDCGACEPECPVEAIFAEEDTPEDQSRFVDINTKYFELRDNGEEWAQWKQEHSADFEKKS